jgi:hypothetical protein
MEFRCEDLARHGVVLLPPGAPGYDAAREDIRKRAEQPVAGSPPMPESMRPRVDDRPAAILVNRAATPIASIYQVWTFEEAGGRTYTSSIGGGTNSSVLLPFGLDDRVLKLFAYWHTILPGSKRLINWDGEIAGDNSDVRAPVGDEVWTGGWMGGRGGGIRARGAVERVTFTLDGVFFTDGAFAGPDRGGLWEQTVFSAEAMVEAARLARRLHDDGAPPTRILDEIRAALGGTAEHIGPPPHRGSPAPEEYRKWAREQVWERLAMSREHGGEDRAVYMLLGWGDARVPEFRKL